MIRNSTYNFLHVFTAALLVFSGFSAHSQFMHSDCLTDLFPVDGSYEPGNVVDIFGEINFERQTGINGINEISLFSPSWNIPSSIIFSSPATSGAACDLMAIRNGANDISCSAGWHCYSSVHEKLDLNPHFNLNDMKNLCSIIKHGLILS